MSGLSSMDDFSVSSYLGDYQVKFVEDFVRSLSAFLEDGDVLLLDQNVSNLYKKRIGDHFSCFQTLLLEPSEALKSYDGVKPVISRLVESGFKRNNRLVAIGGGITQDVTAFIASIIYRGVGWIFVPTNLLSQCDSCIGSKTSINFGPFKNQLGGFYPPSLILMDPTFRETLSSKEVRSGIGEMAHYFLIDGEDSFRALEEGIGEAVGGGEILSQFVKRSLAIKKAMVERDEFDKGPRNVFNYGHSFGHALEGYTEFSIPHGIAVAFGMDVANSLSVGLGLMQVSERDRVREVLMKIWKGTDFPEIDIDRYISILRRDKKNIGSNVRVVLSRGIGDMFLDKIEISDRFVATLEECFSHYRLSSS